MQILKDRIRKDGKIKAGNVLKVDSFLNHQMDIKLFGEIGKEFKRRFADVEVTKILTIEASGIGIACIVAQYFDVPVVFAKKTQTKNIAGEVYTTKVESYTHGRVYDIIVSREFLGAGDKVLLIDDFLATNHDCQLLRHERKLSWHAFCGQSLRICHSTGPDPSAVTVCCVYI